MRKFLDFLTSLIGFLIGALFLFYLLKLMFFDTAQPTFRELLMHPSFKNFINYITDPITILLAISFIFNTKIIGPFIVNFGMDESFGKKISNKKHK